jgi:hypothetical protein
MSTELKGLKQTMKYVLIIPNIGKSPNGVKCLAEDFGGLASTCPDEAIFLLP